MRRFYFLLLFVYAATSFAATPAYLVKDLNTNPAPDSSYPGYFVNVGNVTFFTTNTYQGEPLTLWRTDGTDSGTISLGATVEPPVSWNGRAWFCRRTAGGFNAPVELWSTDGTVAGTIRTAMPDATMSVSRLMPGGARLYFVSNGNLWQTDGTTAGTLKTFSTNLYFRPSVYLTAPDYVAAGSTFYFAAYDGVATRLWRTDAGGTVAVATPENGGGITNLRLVGNTLFFVNTPASYGIASLWRSDGTTAGTFKIKTTQFSSYESIGSSVYFSSDDTDAKLWRTDGTIAGTVAVASSLPGASSIFSAHPIGVVGNRLILLGTSLPATSGGSSGIWSWDGTNTTFLMNTTSSGNTSWRMTSTATYGIFGIGETLYRTDGTIGGTFVLRSFYGSTGYLNWPMIDFGSSILLGGSGDNRGFELWKSDGTSGNTVLLKDLLPTTYGSSPRTLRAFNDGVLFVAASGTDPSARDLWFSDGTDAGTHMVLANAGDWSGLAPCGARAFFAHYDAGSGTELWSTDGSTASLVKDIYPGSANSSYPYNMTCVDGRAYFTARTAAGSSIELWRSDGTAAGTVRVADISSDGYPTPALLMITKFQHGLLLGIRGGSAIAGLWVSDGTPAGTYRVREYVSQSSAAPVYAGGYVWFTTQDEAGKWNLWRTNGTAQGTTIVSPVVSGSLAAFGNRVAYATGGALFTTDGSAAGTYQFENLPYYNSVHEFSFRDLNGRLYYNVPEIRSTDGAQTGVKTGAGEADMFYAVAAGRLYFTQWYSTGVLSETDGTAAGTSRIDGVTAAVRETVASGGRLFIAADELYAYDLPVAAITFTPRVVGVAGGEFVTITGRGFTAPATVTIDGTPATIAVFNSTSITFTAPPHDAGTYDVVLTLGDGRRMTLETPLTYVCNSPTAVVGAAPAPVCPMTPVSLQGSGGTRCVWFPTTGLDNSSSCNPTATVAATTTYTLLVYNDNGCPSTNSPTVTVAVYPPPVPKITSPGTEGMGNVVPNSSYSASVADAGAGATYAWSGEGVVITSDPSQRTINFNTTCARPALNVTVISAPGCSASEHRSLGFTGSMTVTSVKPGLLNPGSPFTATGTGFGCVSNVWLNNVAVPFSIVSPTQLQLRFPANAPNVARLVVESPAISTFSSVLVYASRRDDLRGDTKADVVWRNPATGQALAWSIEDAALTSLPLRAADSTDYTFLATAEFGGVLEFSDAIWRKNSTNQLVVQFMSYGRPYTEAVWPALPATKFVAGVGDIRGDGITQVILRDSETGATSMVMLTADTSGGRFYNEQAIHRGGNLTWDIVGVRDFDGDGKADILWREKNTGQTIVWLMNGATIASSLVVHGGGNTGFDIAGLGDFDGDTKTDILWRERSSGMLILWLMNGSAISQSLVVHYGGNQNWTVAQVGDFTGDGKADVLWREKNTGQTLYWPMNGAQIQSTVMLHPGGNLDWNIETSK